MDTAAHFFLYVAAGCAIALTAMFCVLLYIVFSAITEVRRFMRSIGYEVERLFHLERRVERSTRLAGRWFAHLPARLFQAWGERY